MFTCRSGANFRTLWSVGKWAKRANIGYKARCAGNDSGIVGMLMLIPTQLDKAEHVGFGEGKECRGCG